MASQADSQEYDGVVLKLSKDGTKYIVKCPAIFDWYGVEARLPAAEKPDGVELGDTIRFGVTVFGGGAPVISWAERDMEKSLENAKRKADERSLPAAGEELYEGKVRQQSTKDPKMYLVDCPCVTSWFGIDAKVSADVLFLAGAGVGDEITFSLKPGECLVAWADMKGSQTAKRQRSASDALANSGAGGRAKVSATNGAASAADHAGGDEVSRLRAQLQVERVAKLEAQLEVERSKNAAALGASGIFAMRPAPSVVVPATDWTDELLNDKPATAPKDKGTTKGTGKDKGKPAGPTLIGMVRYSHEDEALSALALYGTELEGSEVRPEADACDPCAVKVLNLAPGTTASKLREHFQEVGRIVDVAIKERRVAGKGKGQAKGKEAKGGTKGRK